MSTSSVEAPTAGIRLSLSKATTVNHVSCALQQLTTVNHVSSLQQLIMYHVLIGNKSSKK